MSHSGGERYSCTQEGSGAFGARVQAAMGLTPLAAPVPPTERAGSEGSVVCRRRRLYTHRSAGAIPPPFEPFEPSEPSEPSRPKGVSMNPLNPGREAAPMHNKKSAKLLFSGFHGDPRGIRTPDTLIRSQVLYPAELLGQIGRGRGTQTPNLRFWRPLLYQLRYAPRRMFLATVLS